MADLARELRRDDRFPAWEESSSFRRAQFCVSMLAIHGVLTSGEADRARKRLVAWVRSHPLENTRGGPK